MHAAVVYGAALVAFCTPMCARMVAKAFFSQEKNHRTGVCRKEISLAPLAVTRAAVQTPSMSRCTLYVFIRAEPGAPGFSGPTFLATEPCARPLELRFSRVTNMYNTDHRSGRFRDPARPCGAFCAYHSIRSTPRSREFQSGAKNCPATASHAARSSAHTLCGLVTHVFWRRTRAQLWCVSLGPAGPAALVALAAPASTVESFPPRRARLGMIPVY